MSRKVIRDFIRQADSLDSSQATAYFETIMEVYEDSVHTAAERVATLESDTLWLLVEYRRIVEAKDNSPEEKQKHRIAQSNLWQLLSVLIESTADKGIYLSEAFVKKYNEVEFVGSEFGEYIRESYSVRKWKAPKPQQKPRKNTTFLDKVQNGHDNIIPILHSLMDGKTGKDALQYLTACIKNGLIIRPTYGQTKEEFGIICEKANYYRYTDPDRYTTKELAAATKAIDSKK